MKKGKKILSLLLTFVMLFTTLCFFSPDFGVEANAANTQYKYKVYIDCLGKGGTTFSYARAYLTLKSLNGTGNDVTIELGSYGDNSNDAFLRKDVTYEGSYSDAGYFPYSVLTTHKPKWATSGSYKVYLYVYDYNSSSYVLIKEGSERSADGDWLEQQEDNFYDTCTDMTLFPYVASSNLVGSTKYIPENGSAVTQALNITASDQYGVDWVNAPTTTVSGGSATVTSGNTKTPTITFNNFARDYTATVSSSWTTGNSSNSTVTKTASYNVYVPRTLYLDDSSVFRLYEWTNIGGSCTITNLTPNSFTATANSNDGNTGFSNRFALKPNTTYVFSADIDYKPLNADDAFDVYFQPLTAEGNSLQGTEIIEGCHTEGKVYVSSTGHKSSVKSVRLVLKTTADTAFGSIRFDANNTGNVINVSNIKFVELENENKTSYTLTLKADKQFKSYTATVPVITGYTFHGWYLDDAIWFDANGNWALENSSELYVKDHFTFNAKYFEKLTSKWTENQYTVAYNANGGTGSMDSAVKMYTDEFTLTKNTFTKVGHNFVGWNTKADGTGTAYTDGASVSKLTSENGATVTLYAQWKPIEYTITWKNHDGTVLGTTQVPYGTMPSYNGTPTREGNEQYSYTFNGWSPKVTSVVGHATYTATFTPVTNTYTVTWKNADGTVLETDTDVPYGTNPTYNGATPTKSATAEFSYVHSGWTPSVSAITGDVTYTATYSEVTREYTVTWKNEDGTVLKTDTVAYGTVPSYTGATPTKAPDAEFTYTFAGWDPAVVAVTGDATYTATYSNTTNTYTVTWKNEDGTVLETDENVPYGTTPEYNGEPPTKAATAQYTYTHSGWTPEVDSVTGDVTYTATFSSTVNEYTITWVDGNGATLKTEKVAYGEKPEYKGDTTPTKRATAQYTYTFNNTWSPEIADVTKDATYTAQFDSTLRSYTVTWVDGDGKAIRTEQVSYGTTPAYIGTQPTKTPDAQYNYSWNNTWSPEITSVTGDVTYKAQFNGTLRSYTVTWVNEDGTVLGTDTVTYGTIPTYTSETPVKAQDEKYTYTFAGWTNEVVAVTGNVTYTAKFDSALRKYTITWVNEDETELFAEAVEYGTLPEYKGETPTKDADVQFTYTFDKWTPEVVAVTGEATYTATFEGTLNKYTVTFVYLNGETVEYEYEYGKSLAEIGTPQITPAYRDDEWHYSYSWPAREGTVQGDITYEETVKETAHNYDYENGKLTRPEFINGEWSDGYYTYTCKVNGDEHEKKEYVNRADYTEYTEALNKLEELLNEDLLENDKNEINRVIAANTVADNLIESEQATIDTATENLRYTFNEMSSHLETVTVTFVVKGEPVKTETVIVGRTATAPADPAKYFDTVNHYTFEKWDKTFTNVETDLVVNAVFKGEEHKFETHTDKDDTYHTDECECGYTKDAEHSYDNGVVTKEPTCTHTGEKTFTCSLCKGTKVEELPTVSTAHKEEDEYIQTIEPTCSAVGEETLYCEYCDAVLDTREVAINPDAHKAEEAFTVIEKATCFADGYKAILCAYCDKELETAVIAKREHNLVDTTVAQAATCITTGIMNQKCDCVETAEYEACTFTTTREIEINPDNHADEADVIKGQKDATCTATGYTGDTYWSCCDKLYKSGTVIPVDADAHTGEADVIKNYKAATCTKEGYTGDIYWSCCDKLSENGKVIEKIAHTEGEVVIENKIFATATEDGSYDEVIYCTVCGEELSRVKKTYSVQEVLPGLPENGKVVVDIDEDGKSTESLDDILGKDSEYESSNDAITVDKDGNITATEDGEAVITVTTPDGEVIDITVTVRTLKTITFVMKDETVIIKAYKGDRLTAPTVNDITEDGFTYTFKSWTPAITAVTGDATYTAIYTEPCDYDEFDRLSGLFEEIVNGGKVDAAVLESNKEIIAELTADIEAINAVRGTRDKSEQAIIDAVVERLDEIVIRLYPDAGSTLEIFGAATYYVGTVIDLRVMKMPLGTVVTDVEWTSSDENVVFFADGKLYAFGTGTATLTATKGLVKATKTVTVVAGGNTRSINFTAVDLTVNFLIEGYKRIYDSTLLYWSDDTELRFRINVYANPVFRDYMVYADGEEIEMDENSYYVIPAGSGDVQIIVAGELYEDEEEDKDPVTKWSLWEWILNFFRKIGDFFRNLFR